MLFVFPGDFDAISSDADSMRAMILYVDYDAVVLC